MVTAKAKAGQQLSNKQLVIVGILISFGLSFVGLNLGISLFVAMLVCSIGAVAPQLNNKDGVAQNEYEKTQMTQYNILKSYKSNLLKASTYVPTKKVKIVLPLYFTLSICQLWLPQIVSMNNLILDIVGVLLTTITLLTIDNTYRTNKYHPDTIPNTTFIDVYQLWLNQKNFKIKFMAGIGTILFVCLNVFSIISTFDYFPRYDKYILFFSLSILFCLIFTHLLIRNDVLADFKDIKQARKEWIDVFEKMQLKSKPILIKHTSKNGLTSDEFELTGVSKVLDFIGADNVLKIKAHIPNKNIVSTFMFNEDDNGNPILSEYSPNKFRIYTFDTNDIPQIFDTTEPIDPWYLENVLNASISLIGVQKNMVAGIIGEVKVVSSNGEPIVVGVRYVAKTGGHDGDTVKKSFSLHKQLGCDVVFDTQNSCVFYLGNIGNRFGKPKNTSMVAKEYEEELIRDYSDFGLIHATDAKSFFSNSMYYRQLMGIFNMLEIKGDSPKPLLNLKTKYKTSFMRLYQ